jgi:peroxiredoxin Q/BCP
MEVLKAYEVLVEGLTKTGRISRKVVRTTYLIDEEGVIVRAFGKVKAKDNAAQMLGELE